MNVSSPAISARSYRPDIDGIRSLAILSVVFYHGGLPLVTGGFTGVDIFFVISGYLIGGHIFAELCAGDFSFLRFYQRRAKRILPAFYAVIVFSILAAFFLLSPAEMIDFGQSSFYATLSSSNIYFWHSINYFSPTAEFSPMLMTWSLGVEEQFYAVIPLLMVLLTRIRRAWLLPAALIVCVLSFILAFFAVRYRPAMAFYVLPTRAWELGAGVVLAVIELSRKRVSLSGSLIQLLSLTGLVLMLAPVFLLSASSPFPGLAALPSVLGTALVIAFPTSWINRRLLALPPLVFIGRISYSLYLWHWPLLCFLRIACGDKPPQWAACMAIAAAFVGAVLSYFFIEQPLRKSVRPPVPLLIRYALVSVVVLAACAALWKSHGVPHRFPQLDPMEQDSENLMRLDPCLVSGDGFPASPRCYNLADTRPTVAVWGDSLSTALSPGLRTHSLAQGYSFAEFGYPACQPFTGAAIYRPEVPHFVRNCINFNRRTLQLLQNTPQIKIVVLVGIWSGTFGPGDEGGWIAASPAHETEKPAPDVAAAIFRQALSASIQALRQAGKQVIVVQQFPIFDVDPVWRIRTAQIPFRHALAAWMNAPSASDPGFSPFGRATASAESYRQVAAIVDQFHDVQLIDLRPELCLNDSHCDYREGDRVLYTDCCHFSVYGAHYALRDFRFPELPPVAQ